MINNEKKKTILYTGGGTAGHIYPGLAVIDTLKRTGGDSFLHCWIGSNRGMDRRLVEDAGVCFYGIPSGKLRRYFSLKNISDMFRVAAGIIRSCFLLLRLRPAVVFSKGGYVSVPVVFAARLLGRTVISHESDAVPGLATRINSRFSSRVLVSFPETLDMLSPAVRLKAEVSGNPVRRALFSGDRSRGRALFGGGEAPALLVLGGSQGARQVNNLVAGCLEGLLKECTVIHQHGFWDEPPVPAPGYQPFDFIGDELPDMLAAASLVVCRAGASTLWELAALGKPAVLIPLGTGSSRGDQLANARIFADRGAAVVLTGDISPKDLLDRVTALLNDPSGLETMGCAARRLAEKRGSEYISHIIQKEAKAYGRTSNN